MSPHFIYLKQHYFYNRDVVQVMNIANFCRLRLQSVSSLSLIKCWKWMELNEHFLTKQSRVKNTDLLSFVWKILGLTDFCCFPHIVSARLCVNSWWRATKTGILLSGILCSVIGLLKGGRPWNPIFSTWEEPMVRHSEPEGSSPPSF